MTTRGVSTKEKLLSLVDDIELISKELFESTIAPKAEKLSVKDQSLMMQLVRTKNDDLKETLKIAKEQAEMDVKMMELQAEVSRYDREIQTLQKFLKEAETHLSTSLFQAKQKLEQITRAQNQKCSSEELIRFSHRISSTNAVAAPPNWQPGDPRRPYPTDLEMRMGLLARLNDLPMSQVLDSMPRDMNNGNNMGNPFPPWHPHHSSGAGGQTPDHHASSSSGTMFHPPSHSGASPAVGFDSGRNQHEDVEVMSTDSSSSSSSDSQ